MHKLITNILIYLVFLIPITSFAYSPAPSPFRECQRMQRRLTDLFHECCRLYNSEGHTPQIDGNSSTLTYDTAIKFLIENGYIANENYSRNSNCKLDLKYFPDGIKSYHDYKNIFYCKFHGSEDCGIETSYREEFAKENRTYRFHRSLSLFMFQNEGFIMIGFAIIIYLIGKLFYKFVISK